MSTIPHCGPQWKAKLIGRHNFFGEDLPQARILAFEYTWDLEEERTTSPFSPRTPFFPRAPFPRTPFYWASMANGEALLPPTSVLIRRLLNQRKDSGTEHRKIIFIAHGLGCFICQEVILAKAHTKMFGKITAGIPFLNPQNPFSEHLDRSSTLMKHFNLPFLVSRGRELMRTLRNRMFNAPPNIKTLLIRHAEDFKHPCSSVSAFLVCLDFMLIIFTA
jgi:hypothetical protein